MNRFLIVSLILLLAYYFLGMLGTYFSAIVLFGLSFFAILFAGAEQDTKRTRHLRVVK